MKTWTLFLLAIASYSLFSQTQFSVTSYGAVGNSTNCFFGTTSNSATFTCTVPVLVSNSVQINGVGPWGIGSLFHQGLVAYIISTNLMGGVLDRPCLYTSNAAPGFVGLDCTPAFEACYAAATNSLPAQINVTNGWYMLLLPTNYNGGSMDTTRIISAINEYGGNISWVGQSKSGTVLIGCGVWEVKGAVGFRGSIFQQNGGGSTLPEVFTNFTFNGSAIQGYTGLGGNSPMNPTNGLRWDNTHHAYVDATGPLPLSITFGNCLFTNFEGEQVIGTVTTTSRFVTMINVQFGGGDATAVNFPYPHYLTNISCSGIQEFEEYDNAGQTLKTLETKIFLTNCYNGWALSGGTMGDINPLFTLTNFNAYGSGGGVLTASGTNELFINGLFSFPAAFQFSTAGGEGDSWNGNIIVLNNVFTNCYYAFEFGNEQGPVANVSVTGNIWYYPTNQGGAAFAINGSSGTNNNFYYNSIINAFGAGMLINSSGSIGQYFYDDPSDNFPSQITVGAANLTNTISYYYGYHQAFNPMSSGCSASLDDSQPLKIPTGASMIVTNAGTTTATLYSSATPSFAGAGVSMPAAYSQVWLWNNFTFRWQTNPVTSPIIYYLMRVN